MQAQRPRFKCPKENARASLLCSTSFKILLAFRRAALLDCSQIKLCFPKRGRPLNCCSSSAAFLYRLL